MYSWGKRKCAAVLCLRFVTCVLSVPVCLLFLLVSLLDHGSEPRLLRSLCLDMNSPKSRSLLVRLQKTSAKILCPVVQSVVSGQSVNCSSKYSIKFIGIFAEKM